MRNAFLRKLVVLMAAVGLVGIAGSASAGFFQPLDSTLKVTLGSLPTLSVTGTYTGGGWATVSNNGAAHDLTDSTGIWTTTNNQVGTSLLTGIALINSLTLTAQNNAGSFTASWTGNNPWGGNQAQTTTPTSNGTPTGAPQQNPNWTSLSGTLCPAGCLGGNEGLTGQFIVGILGSPKPFSLSVVGGNGATDNLPIGGNQIVATGGPFLTGKAKITNITTNVLFIPGRPATGVGVTLQLNPTEQASAQTFTTNGGVVQTNPGATNLEQRATVTMEGTNTLASASAGGMVTLISPLRIQTGPLGVGNIPGVFVKKFTFVPEPGTMLLLASGAAGLVFIARKRMKS